MIKYLFGLIFILILQLNCAIAQKSVSFFNVSLDGKLLGVMEASKEISGNEVKYNLHSSVDTKIFTFNIEVESELNALTREKILVEGTNYQHSNRKDGDVTSSIKKTSPLIYEVTKNGVSRIISVPEIHYCVIDMYFYEPLGISTVFSIADAEFLKVQPLGNSQYELVLSNGKKDIFTYSNGELVSMKAPIAIGGKRIERQ